MSIFYFLCGLRAVDRDGHCYHHRHSKAGFVALWWSADDLSFCQWNVSVVFLHPWKAEDERIFGCDSDQKGDSFVMKGADLKLEWFGAVCVVQRALARAWMWRGCWRGQRQSLNSSANRFIDEISCCAGINQCKGGHWSRGALCGWWMARNWTY